MQTFLPYPDFRLSAECLDYRRLGKQRVEAMQIINVLEGRSEGWKNHPAVKMWIGYTDALKCYFNVISEEWIKRGYKHNIGFYEYNGSYSYPYWVGDHVFHLSHQSNLVRKLPEHYRKYFPEVKDDLPYIWPKGVI